MSVVSTLLPVAAALVIASFPPLEVAAQTVSGAQSLGIGPSIRASGMGRSSAAVFWGGDPDSWANPALLGYRDGLRFDHGKTQLVPDLANDVFFKTDRFSFGRWGIGVGASVSPFGRNRLDYGRSTGTDGGGHELGSFESYEEYDDLAAGVSLATFIDAITHRADRTGPELSRYGDIAIGVARKSVHVDLAPGWATPSGRDVTGDVSTRDVGYLFRFTPIQSIGGRSLVPILDDAFEALGGVRLDLAYGYSKQNTGEVSIEYSGINENDRVVSPVRKALAVHAEIGFPPGLARQYREAGRGWLAPSLTPLVSFGWSRETLELLGLRGEEKIRNWGAELSLANMLHVRMGHVDDASGQIVDSTWGLGLGFELDRLGGIRVDHGTVPQARGLDTVGRWGFTIFADPWEITRWLTADSSRPNQRDPGGRR